MRRPFFVVRFNCNKKCYMQKLPSFNIEGGMLNETCVVNVMDVSNAL